jgi:GNAT superfamily N-acetyltransferase
MDLWRRPDVSLGFRYQTNLQIGGPEWTNHRVEAWRNDQELGHLTIAFIERETFTREFPDLDSYVRRMKGYQEVTDYLRERYADAFKRFEQFHVETAHVAYVLVEGRHQRKGLGTQLYIQGASWMAERHGLMLAASDLQSPGPEVPRVWEKLVADPDVHTVKLDDGRWAIDGSQDLGTESQGLGLA